MLILNGFKTPSKYVLTATDNATTSYSQSYEYVIRGKTFYDQHGQAGTVTGTWLESYFMLKFPSKDSLLSRIEVAVPPKRVFSYWQLKNKTLKSDQIPETIKGLVSLEDTCYEDIESLYETVYTDVAQDPLQVIYTLNSVDVAHEINTDFFLGNTQIPQNKINVPDLLRIFYPPMIAYSLSPCSLSHEESMKYLHDEINKRLDKNQASISISSYGKIEVKISKILPLLKSETEKKFSHTTGRGRSKKDHYFDVVKTTFTVPFFNSSSDLGEKFCLTGNNWDDLKQKALDLVDQIVEQANTPLHACQHCSTYGYTGHEKFTQKKKDETEE